MNLQTPLVEVDKFPITAEKFPSPEEDGDFRGYLNVDDVLRRVSYALANHIRAGEKLRDKVSSNAKLMPSISTAATPSAKALIFSKKYDEEHFVKQQRRYTVMQCQSISPFSCYISAPVVSSHKVPSPVKIFHFFSKMFHEAKLDGQCVVVCLVYMERLMRSKQLHLLATNWRPLTLAGVLIAAKMSQDIAPLNSDFQAIFPAFSLKAVKELESELARLLEWNFQVKKEVYQKYHVALRSIVYDEPTQTHRQPLMGRRNFRSKFINILKVDIPNGERFATGRGLSSSI